MHCENKVGEFDESMNMTLKGKRSHFGIISGTLIVEGKIKVEKEDGIVPPGTYVLDTPQKNQSMRFSILFPYFTYLFLHLFPSLFKFDILNLF